MIITLGLTGSIAMGKSTAAAMLSEMRGVAVFDSDAAVHQMYKDPDMIGLIRATFPKAYNRNTGQIDRAALRDFLDFDHEKWDVLEQIVHPFVQQKQRDFLLAAHRNGVDIAVFDIPLLFETNAQDRLDYTLCVTAPAFLQYQRAVVGREMNPDLFEFVLSRQMSDAEKRMRADFVVQTGNGKACTRARLSSIISKIRNAKKKRK